jgi:hypothetical protein
VKISVVLLLVLGGVACSDAVQPARPTIAGRYVLETVNGGQIPVVIMIVPPEVIRLKSGVIHLRADSTFTDTTVVEYDRSPFGGVDTETLVREGRWGVDEFWTLDGNTIERFEARRLPLMDLTLRYVKH